jgi:hypothetical protein
VSQTWLLRGCLTSRTIVRLLFEGLLQPRSSTIVQDLPEAHQRSDNCRTAVARAFDKAGLPPGGWNRGGQNFRSWHFPAASPRPPQGSGPCRKPMDAGRSSAASQPIAVCITANLAANVAVGRSSRDAARFSTNGQPGHCSGSFFVQVTPDGRREL